jgi:hypothetical protein
MMVASLDTLVLLLVLAAFAVTGARWVAKRRRLRLIAKHEASPDADAAWIRITESKDSS